MAQALSTNLGPVPSETPAVDRKQQRGSGFSQPWSIWFEAIRTTVNRAPQIVTTVPANSAAKGLPGQIAYDANFLYVCVAKDTWRRVALAAF